MRFSRPADPTKRRPAWLQSYTKENYLAQLIAAVVLFVCMETKETIQERRQRRELDAA